MADQPPAKKPKLERALAKSPARKFTAVDLSKYLKDNNMPQLAGWVETKGYDGEGLVAELDNVPQEAKDELETLSNLLQAAPAQVPVPAKKEKTFSVNTDIKKGSDHFFVERRKRSDLLDIIEKESDEIDKIGGIILIHGPRSSGKTTLSLQLMSHIDRDEFVVGQVQTPDREMEENQRWQQMMESLALNQNTSPEVQAAARSFLPFGEPLVHLFRSDYGGKKLVLFWDEFDIAYGRPEIAAVLRFTWDQCKQGTLPAFQAIVCLGAYNSALVAASKASPFVRDKVYTADVLNFTAAEVTDIFHQYEDEYNPKREVDLDVQANILEITAGHTGLVNACGQVIQNDKGTPHMMMERWQDLLSDVVTSMKSRGVFEAMMDSLKKVEDPDGTRRLLRRLCYGTGEYMRREPRFTDLLQLGLASIAGQGANEKLVIKSEMIQRFVIQHIMTDAAIFEDELPLLPESSELDVINFLVEIFRHFDPDVMKSSYTWSHKQHERDKHVDVPEEAVYQHQFSATILRAIKGTKWMLAYEVNSDKKKLDFLLRRPKEDGRPEYRVGIELTASVNQASLKEHASRDYPITKKLDLYVIVNLTSYQTEPEFSTFSCKVEKTITPLFGKQEVVEYTVPIFHLLHDREYKSVKLYHTDAHTSVPIL